MRVRQDVRRGERARARDRGIDRGDRSFDRFRRILSMDRDRLARRRRRVRPVQMAARQSPGWSSCVAAPGGRRVVGSHLAELRHEVLRVLDHVLGAQALGGGLGGGLAVRAGGGRQRDLAREAARGGSRGAQNAHPRGSSGEFVRGGGGRAVARDALRDRSRFRARTCGRDPMAKLANPSPAAAPAPPGRRLTPAPPGRSEMASIVLSRPGGGARESALAKRGAFSKPAREARLVRSRGTTRRRPSRSVATRSEDAGVWRKRLDRDLGALAS